MEWGKRLKSLDQTQRETPAYANGTELQRETVQENEQQNTTKTMKTAEGPV
jgi:hypothetical protein